MALPLVYNLRNLRVRWKVTVLAVVGVAVVVAVVVVLLAMRTGFGHALRATGRRDNAILVQRGSGGAELSSGISHEHAMLMATDPRVARGTDGQPLASPELVIVANLKRKADGQPTNVTLRGVTPRAFEVRSGIRILEGRAFKPGLNEIIVGERMHERIQNFDVGSKVQMQRRDWEVVGVFASEGSAFESEAWADADALASAFQRQGGYQSVTVRLNEPPPPGEEARSTPSELVELDKRAKSGEKITYNMYDRWNQELVADPRLDLEVDGERAYYANQAGPVANALIGLVGFVSLVMGLGAVFGAMNTMYGIVASRTREVGTLRALGFSRRSILFTFLVESLVLALLGGALGCLIALPINGYSTATGYTATFSEIAFAFRVAPSDVVTALVFSAVMGVVGGFLPALRAARLPITVALREA